MGKMGTFQIQDFKKFQKELEEIKQESSSFLEGCAKELAARLLTEVVKRTPVGEGVFQVVKGPDGKISKYQKGKKKGEVKLERLRSGGVLRRGWISKTQGEAEQKSGSPSAREVIEYTNGLAIEHMGGMYRIVICNVVAWSSYVEYGHRQKPGRFVPVLGKKLKKAWVPGVFMLTISEQKLQKLTPALLEKKIKKFLGESLS